MLTTNNCQLTTENSSGIFSLAELNREDWLPLLEAFRDADNLGSLITPPAFDAGKLLGQVGLALLALGIGVGLSAAMGLFLMVGQPVVGTVGGLLARVPAILAFSLPALGLGLGASMAARTVSGARALALIGFFGSFIAYVWLKTELRDNATSGGVALWERLADLAMILLFPSSWTALWSPEWPDVLAAMARCAIIGAGCFAAGMAVFSRRDL